VQQHEDDEADRQQRVHGDDHVDERVHAYSL
jgi:hypothetical protein